MPEKRDYLAGNALVLVQAFIFGGDGGEYKKGQTKKLESSEDVYNCQ